MRPKPTKEEVEDWKIAIAKQKTSDESVAILFKDDASRLCEAYLALREDLEKLDEYIVSLVRENVDLKAENQALRARVEILDNMPSSGTGGQP